MEFKVFRGYPGSIGNRFILYSFNRTVFLPDSLLSQMANEKMRKTLIPPPHFIPARKWS